MPSDEVLRWATSAVGGTSVVSAESLEVAAATALLARSA